TAERGGGVLPGEPRDREPAHAGTDEPEPGVPAAGEELPDRVEVVEQSARPQLVHRPAGLAVPAEVERGERPAPPAALLAQRKCLLAPAAAAEPVDPEDHEVGVRPGRGKVVPGEVFAAGEGQPDGFRVCCGIGHDGRLQLSEVKCECEVVPSHLTSHGGTRPPQIRSNTLRSLKIPGQSRPVKCSWLTCLPLFLLQGVAMSLSRTAAGCRKLAFTLIELLVVIAIIA